jgi:photosystem II stability/assembly factor-like uncharacterized protein
MKILLRFFTVIFLSLSAALGADWHLLPTGIQNDIRGFSFCDENNGIFATKNGNIVTYLKSNGKIKSDSIDAHLSFDDIFAFPDCRHLIACGNDGIIMTSSDGGVKWEIDTIGLEKYWLQDMAFLDDQQGFIVGRNTGGQFADQGLLYRSSNGGKLWDSIAAPGRGLSSINISPDGIISTTGMGHVYISRDTGNSWEDYKITPGKSVRAVAINGKNGIMIGMSGFLALSGDAGKSWKDHPVFPDDFHGFDLLMIDEMRAYAVGAEGMIFYTDDAGYNWIPEQSGTPNSLVKIIPVGDRIYCCGQKGTIVYTEDNVK